eukprot:GHVU01148697.1.p5 GENE.GHVU01148697.1~~GHVU01148697.1.p5  ORF type:complete len:101 (-),score=23.57 GHVU01148697.1:981-1283(-)
MDLSEPSTVPTRTAITSLGYALINQCAHHVIHTKNHIQKKGCSDDGREAVSSVSSVPFFSSASSASSASSSASSSLIDRHVPTDCAAAAAASRQSLSVIH